MNKLRKSVIFAPQRLASSRKAQTDTIMNWVLYRLPIIIFVSIFFAIALRSYYTTGLNSHDIENMVLMKRIIYSDNLLAYRDPITDRTFPGIVDNSKFSTEKLEEQLQNKNNRLAVYMELENINTGDSGTAYINEERARAWKDYVFIEGFESTSATRYVKIYKDKKFYQGVLRIRTLVRE